MIMSFTESLQGWFPAKTSWIPPKIKLLTQREERRLIKVIGKDMAREHVLRLVRETAELDDPILRISVGRVLDGVEDILSLASECNKPESKLRCDTSSIRVHLNVHEEPRDTVNKALRNASIRIIEERIFKGGNFPSFMVSQAGYYVKDARRDFDEANMSFVNSDMRDFLIKMFNIHSQEHDQE